MIQKNKIPLLLRVTLPIVSALLVFSFSVFIGLFTEHKALAATNSTVNFQARLMTSPGAIAADGDYNVEFKIYNASSSSGSSQGSCTGDSACLWTETRTSGNRVRVANGYLTVNLGSVTAFPAINWDQDLWISLNIGGKNVSAVWDGEMSPRLKLTAVPYAFRAGQLVATNGSFSSTLGFVQPTANRTIQAPDESGTICLQNSANCGFVTGSSASFIQNQNSSDQTANFRISGTGRAGTALQAPLFDTATAVALNIGTTNATVINLNKATVITGGITQSGGAISLTGNTASTITTSSGALSLQSAANLNLAVSGTQSINLNTGSAGVIVKPTTDNANAFQVQNAGGGYVFSVDTSANTIGLGTLLVTTPTIFDGNIDTYFSGTIGIGTSTATVLNLGRAGSNVTLQGNASSTFKATSGSFTTTLGFTTPTANRAINLPNEAGTVCLQSSTACSFAPSSGSANYIQNSTSVQSANFYVQAATSGTVAGIIRANTGGTGNILNLQNGAGTNVATFGSTGSVLLQNSTNSTAAFQVSASSGAGGNSILRVDSTNERVAIGVISDPIGAKLSIATSNTVALRAYQGGSSDAFQLGNASADFLTVGSTGNVLIRPSTNSSNAFQIQKQNGSQMLGVDTQNTVTNIHGGTSQVGGWKSTNSIPNSVRYTSSASANGFVYSVGGYESGTARTVVSYAQQSSDGTLGTWQSGTALPAGTYATSVVTANNYIYVVGGQQAGGVTSTIYYATINPTTGAVGAWSSGALPTTLGWGSATVANGYLYYAGGYNGTTNVSTVYYAQLNAGTGAVGSWTTSPNSLPATRDSGYLTSLNNFLYFTGGVTSTNVPVATTYVASINAGTGAVAAWSSSVSLPSARAYHGSFASNGYIYVVGGQDATTTQFTTYYAKQNTDGTLVSWNAGSSLPSASSGPGVAISNGYAYVMGGWNGTTLSSTYFASIQNIVSINADLVANGTLTLQSSTNAVNALQVQNASGSPVFNVNTSDNVVTLNASASANGANSTWGTPGVMPDDLDGAGAVEVNGYTYILGGYDGTNYLSGVYYGRASSSGVLGPWKVGNSLPGPRGFASAVAVNGYIYLIGGNNNGTFSGSAYYAKVNLDGSLGAWQTTTAFPSSAVRAYGSAVTANGYIYFMGGRGNSVYNTTTYYAKPAADGSISGWTAGTALPAARAQHASIAGNNYIYVLGGTPDGTTAVSTAYYASVNPTTGAIGSWQTTSSLGSNNMNLTAASANGYAYAVGGYNGTSVLNTIQYATMNSDGTLGTWQTSPKSMTTGVSFGTAVISNNNYLYMLGGYNGFSFNSSIYATALQGLIAVSGNLSVGGSASFQSADSATAFQVQNSSGGQMLNIDTLSNTITLHGNNSGKQSAWKQTSNLSATTSFAGTTVANGYVYSIGGFGSTWQSTVQVAKFNPDGTTGAWTSTTSLPLARAYVSAVSSAGYIYALGGTQTGSGGTNTIYVGKQGSDGLIPAWQESGNTLPYNVNAMAAAVSNGYLYILGGNTGSPVNTTYYAKINGDGSLGAFTAGPNLPAALANAQAVVANGYIYFIGGYTGSTAVSSVYYAALNSTTGAMGSWQTTTSMPTTYNNFGTTVANGYLYVYKSAATYYAPFNSDGTLGQWIQESNSIPITYNGISAVTYNGYNYILGGYTGSIGSNGVYYNSGARTFVAGTLDLVGITTKGSGYSDDSGGNGNTGGALIAGNTTIMGSMQVQGQAEFSQNVAINSNSLTIGNDTNDSDTIVTVHSRNYAGIHILGDMGNVSGEPGGAFVLFGQDEWGTRAITGMVQTADLSPQGDTYTGALANAYLSGIYNNFAMQFGTNATVRMTILGNGNVCIAATTCTKKLGVTGTIGASGAITANTTPDLAETIPAAADVEAADVVMADPNNTERVVKSDRAYNAAAVGVISDGTSSFMINSYGGSADAPLTGRPLVLVGRVPVKVTNEGGSIRPGDLLTSASKRGYAMKATSSGPTIGTALGYFNGSEGTVLVLVNLGHKDTGLQGGGNSDFHNINATGTTTVQQLVVAGSARVQGSMEVGSLTTNGHVITKGSAPTLNLQPGSGADATASINGNDTAGYIAIKTGSGAAADYLLRVTFSEVYSQAPRVVLTPVGKNSALIQAYVDQTNGDGFTLGVAGAPEQGREYQFNYQIMQ